MNITVNTNSGYYDTGAASGVGQIGEIRETAPRQPQVPADALKNVKSGDTFSGQVMGTDKDGNVQILLGNQTTVNAKLSGNISLNAGQIVSFQVNSSSQSKITLTPLFTNLDGNSAIGKALDQAFLPRTQDNIELVSAMMERGLPVDAKSLQEMSYIREGHPLADPKSIVQMTELNIPLTEENIKEFQVYKENQHQIADSVFELSEGFAEIAKESTALNNEITRLFFGASDPAMKEALAEAIKTGDTSKLMELLEGNSSAAEGLQGGGEGAEAVSKGLENAGSTELNPEGVLSGKGADIEGALIEEASQNAPKGTPQKAVFSEGGDSIVTKGDIEKLSNRDITGRVTDDPKALLGEEGLKELSKSLKAAGLPEALTGKIAEGGLNNKQIFDITKTLLEQASAGNLSEEAKAAARELIQREPYQLLLRNQITDRFLLKPEDVADKDKVRQYYEHISNEAKGAMNLLNRLGQENTRLSEGVKELSRNLDFMNELNHVMTYIQLPLKLNNNKAHGDLYVYTNKKNLAKKDGNVSALLHLDMEHLGTMDIHVAMNGGQKVQTHFVLQNEEFLDFIGSHLNELDEALARRGYTMHSDISLNREEKNVPDIMFNRGANDRLIQSTSFDLRA